MKHRIFPVRIVIAWTIQVAVVYAETDTCRFNRITIDSGKGYCIRAGSKRD